MCDGARELRERKIYKVDCPYYSNGTYVYEIVNTYPYDPGYNSYNTHINWGQGGDYYNGWYGGNPAHPGGAENNYQHFREYLSVRPLGGATLPPGGGPIILPPGGGTIIPPISGGGGIIVRPIK